VEIEWTRNNFSMKTDDFREKRAQRQRTQCRKRPLDIEAGLMQVVITKPLLVQL